MINSEYNSSDSKLSQPVTQTSTPQMSMLSTPQPSKVNPTPYAQAGAVKPMSASADVMGTAVKPTGIVGPSVNANPRRNVNTDMRNMTPMKSTIASMPSMKPVGM